MTTTTTKTNGESDLLLTESDAAELDHAKSQNYTTATGHGEREQAEYLQALDCLTPLEQR